MLAIRTKLMLAIGARLMLAIRARLSASEIVSCLM